MTLFCRYLLVDRSVGAHTDGKGCTLLQAVGRQVVCCVYVGVSRCQNISCH